MSKHTPGPWTLNDARSTRVDLIDTQRGHCARHWGASMKTLVRDIVQACALAACILAPIAFWVFGIL